MLCYDFRIAIYCIQRTQLTLPHILSFSSIYTLHLNILHFIATIWHQILRAINQKWTYAASLFMLLCLLFSSLCVALSLTTYGFKDFSKFPAMLSSCLQNFNFSKVIFELALEDIMLWWFYPLSVCIVKQTTGFFLFLIFLISKIFNFFSKY